MIPDCKITLKYEQRPWIGFDLDGTLAIFDSYGGPFYIGAPIFDTVVLIRRFHSEGQRVKIFTARVSKAWKKEIGLLRARGIKPAIERWCEKYLGFIPEITAEKDHFMVGLYDDIRLVQIKRNEGITAP